MKMIILFFLGLSLSAIAMHRQLGSYGVETDFYGGFLAEARRIITGESLHVRYHPPLYPFLLATVYLVVGDWFRSGLFISVVSAVFAVGAVHALFRDLYNRYAALGAALGLALWPQFLVLAISASSDVFFLSLMMGSLAVAVGGEILSNRRAFCAGLVGGLAALTRTNGITLILIVLFAATRAKDNRKMKSAAVALGGFLLPWAVWLMLSQVSGSPIFPSGNYIDTAVTFFAPEGARDAANSENWAFATDRFSSLLDVLLFDPPVLIAGVLGNLLLNIFVLFRFAGSLWILLGFASLFSIFWLVLQKSNPKLLLPFWLIYAAQYAVLALRIFDSRYFLFLVPVIAAGAFLLARAVNDRIGVLIGPSRRTGRLAISVVVLALTIVNGRLLIGFINREPVEVLEAAALLKTIARGDEYILARKPHLSFYSGLAGAPVPLGYSEQEVYRDVCSDRLPQKVFLFYGREEAQRRPGLRALQAPTEAPAWLTSIGQGPVGSPWVLYKISCAAH